MGFEERFEESVKGMSEEQREARRERLHKLHLTTLDKLCIIIDQPLGFMSFMAKALIFGASAAVCTVGLSAAMESRRLRKQTLNDYQKFKASSASMQGMGKPQQPSYNQQPSYGVPAGAAKVNPHRLKGLGKKAA